MKKRILSWLLSVVMVVSMVPVAAFATEVEGDGEYIEVTSANVSEFAAVPTDDATKYEVAQTGGEKYESLADAIANAENGGTVTLLDDVNVGNGITIGHSKAKVITIDLNGYKLSGNGVALTAFRAGTEVTLKNGTVHGNSTGGTLVTTYNGKLILGDDLNVTSGSQAAAIKVNGGKLEVPGKNVTVTGGKDCIVLGSESDADRITISGGTYTEEIPEAWYIEDYGSVNNDGTWTVQRVKFVLNKTTGDKYGTLADAIAAIPKGADIQTLKLLDNTTAKGQFIGHSYAQDVILDLNGYTLSSTDKTLTIYRSGTEVIIKNGTVAGNTTGGTIQVTYGGKLTLGENVTVKSGGSANALKVDDNSTLIIDAESVKVLGGLEKNKRADIIASANAKVEISAGSFSQPVNADWCAVGAAPADEKTEEGYYTVEWAADARIGETAYKKLSDAFVDAKEGDTVEILRNVSEVVIPEGFTGVLCIKNCETGSIVNNSMNAEIVIDGNVVVENENGSAISGKVLNISGTEKGSLTAIAGDVKGAFGIGSMDAEEINLENLYIVEVKGGFDGETGTDFNYYKNAPEGGAAIGSGYDGAVINLTNVVIDHAVGGSKAAGIGARYWTGVTINITDCEIKNVEGGVTAAGIGGSRVSGGATESEAIVINIETSEIIAQGGAFAAGIGSGYDTHCQSNQPVCTIHIDDSDIKATGGQYAAGVGTGYHNAGLAGEIKNSTVVAVSGKKFYKDTYTQAQDIGFGVVDPAREAKDNTSSITYNGTEIGIPTPASAE